MAGRRASSDDWRLSKYAYSQYLERFDFLSRPFCVMSLNCVDNSDKASDELSPMS